MPGRQGLESIGEPLELHSKTMCPSSHGTGKYLEDSFPCQGAPSCHVGGREGTVCFKASMSRFVIYSSFLGFCAVFGCVFFADSLFPESASAGFA